MQGGEEKHMMTQKLQFYNLIGFRIKRKQDRLEIGIKKMNLLRG